MALVYIRPDADIVDGSWVNESANNTNLYDSLNETSPIDTDYIRSSNNPANDIVTLRLSNFASAVTEPMTVRYRYKAVSTSGDPLSLKVRLVQGAGGSPATTIAEWQHSDAAATYQDASQLLTTAQFDAITDFTDLFLELEAITGSLGAMALLAGETEGFAIDVTDVTSPAYVGGPEGGSVAIIDTGSPSNNLDNVPLDSSILVQSGTSPKMVYYPVAPYIRWTAHNYALRSEDLGTGWTANGNLIVTTNQTTAPDGASTADKIANAAVPSTDYIQGPGSGSLSGEAFVYTGSIYLKAVDATWVRIGFLGNGGSGIDAWVNVATGATGTFTPINSGAAIALTSTSVGDGWYRFAATTPLGAASSGSFTLTLVSTDGGTTRPANVSCYVWGSQIVRGHNANPYLATTNATRIGIPREYISAASKYAMLSEYARTNLALQSEDISTTWTNTNSSESTNSTTSPTGATDADSLIEDNTASAVHRINQDVTLTSGGDYVFTVFAKAGTRTRIQMRIDTDAGANGQKVGFDLSGGQIAYSASTFGSGFTLLVSPQPEPIGDGWYRCCLRTRNGTSTAATIRVYLDNGSGTGAESITYNGDNASLAYLWGFQLEEAALIWNTTTYIPTATTTATRGEDLVSANTALLPYSSSTSTMYGDGYQTSAVYGSFWHVLYGSANEHAYWLWNVTTMEFGVMHGTQQMQEFRGAASEGEVGDRMQASFAIAANDCAANLNGGTNITDSTVTMPNAATKIAILNSGTSGSRGYTTRFVYVPRRVSNGDLPTWRTNYP